MDDPLLISGQRHEIFHLHSCRHDRVSNFCSILSPSCFSFSLCFLNFKLKSSTEENTIELI